MKFTQENNTNVVHIRSWSSQGPVIGERLYTQSLILTPDSLRPWPPRSIAAMDETAITPLLENPAEVVLLGSGLHQCFPSREQLAYFYRQGISPEIMDSGAACRTFNVLAAEGRQVILGLIVEENPGNPI
jgi:uncharacterized protein